MKIIGRLLKKTAEIGFKRNYNKGLSFDYQVKSLKFLLEKAKKTDFGKNHDFMSLLKSEQMIQDYQKEVPMVDYDEFYQTWLHRSIDGLKDHTWPGKIQYYALSSGTTGSPSKRIPITKETIKSFQKTSMKQIMTLHQLDLPVEFFQKSILVVGGSTELNSIENHIEGDLSGILKKHTSWIASPFTQPSNKIADIKDWNKKLDKMVEQAPNWDIGIVAGVPSWCIMLMERIIDHHKLKSIHEIWPNFHVYVHGGVFMQPYLKRMAQVSGQKVHLLDTYLASEGYFAYQSIPNSSSMKLLLNNEIFYEFVPFDDKHFTTDGKLINRYKALTVDEVESGVDYALIISTNAGLWRYIIGDLVQFTDVKGRQIKITGRIKQYLSLVGEHLSLDNINQALEHVGQEMEVDVQEFCIYIDFLNQRHVWSVGSNEFIDTDLFIQKLDYQLGKLNDDYKSVRKASLNTPTLQCVKTDLFYKFMEKMGKLGSQNKFPRVMNEHQASEWKRFLSDNK
ncbi:MAG: GH3 auxin-responsive promoter family protein [Flavobacteriia bacterium]|jgi:phenylacetate-coenzyme A ligase PaaK-like adenylate-forming protein